MAFIEIKGAGAFGKWNDIVQQMRAGLLGPNSAEEAPHNIEAAFQVRPICAPPNSRTAVLVIEPTFRDQYCQILSAIFNKIKQY